MAKKTLEPPTPEPTPAELERAHLMEMPLIERNRRATLRAQTDGLPLHEVTFADLKRMNVPPEFWSCGLEGVTPTVRTEISNYQTHFRTFERAGSGLYLYGLPGVGKTGAAVALLKFMRSNYHDGYFIKVSEVREAMRLQLDFDADMTISERVRSVDFLVLDSLTGQDLSLPYFRIEDLIALVALRGESHKPTVVTSTLEPSLVIFEKANFFPTVGKFLVTQEVTGDNRRSEERKILSKLLKGS
jgi:DNA replication protein DnaC